ncbi:Short transient receptor potential channel 4 [Trichinella pseudospiralis]|uniref:Short transient receptor potential channel 4 n=1 Tax=Trichinella pseudospiralis TaxID=6337 RepID=A0A0V0XFI5_TRIPS|nr:Short transient receptor potential channel 4 [Trichinella pseudospiralis]
MLMPVKNIFNGNRSTVYTKSHQKNLHKKIRVVHKMIKQAIKEYNKQEYYNNIESEKYFEDGEKIKCWKEPYTAITLSGLTFFGKQQYNSLTVTDNEKSKTSTTAMDTKSKGGARDIFDLIDCGKEDELANCVSYAILRKKWKPILKWLPKIEYRLKETVLIAVFGSEVKVVAALLRDRRYDVNSELPVLFPDYLTPIIVAAQMGNYKMIKLLVEMGYRVPVPHRAGCICNECEIEKNHKDDDIYSGLKENLRRLPTALILCCQTEEEAAVMLKESQGAPVGSLTAFPRVSVAIDTDQKDFLNDPRCLTVLKKKFKGEWADWNGLSNSEKVARIAVHTVGYPITSLVNVLTNGKVFKSYSTPVARYDLILMSIYLLAFNAFMNSWLEVKHHGQPYAHRVHWDPYHPTLLFEVLFTFASVMASWRLFYFFQIFRAYGPIVVTFLLLLLVHLLLV